MLNPKIFFKKNSSTILAITASVGVVATSILTAKSVIKASKIIEKAEEERGEELTLKEKASEVWSIYIPPVVTGVSTIACIMGANVLSRRQQASLASAYGLVSSSYNEYKKKLKELYGEEAHENIMESIAAEKCKDVYISSETLCTSCDSDLGDPGDTYLFYDDFGGRYFEATVDRVRQAEYHLNRNFHLRGCADLNEFYIFLGLEPTDYGAEVGWSIYNGDDIQWIDFNHYKATLDDGLECYIIEMPFCPRRRLFGRLRSIAKKALCIMKGDDC